MLSCEICEIFKNIYFEEHLWMGASKLNLKRDYNTGVFLWILWLFSEQLFCKASTKGSFRNTSTGVCL